MTTFMNEPITTDVTDEMIYADFSRGYEPKELVKRYDMTAAEVRKAIKRVQESNN